MNGIHLIFLRALCVLGAKIGQFPSLLKTEGEVFGRLFFGVRRGFRAGRRSTAA